MAKVLHLHWLRLHPKKKWHGWPHGGNSALCGTVTTLQLCGTMELRGAAPVLGDNVCVVCARIARLVSAPPDLTRTAAAWYGSLSKQVVRARVAYPAQALAALAERFAEVGPPTDPEARLVCEYVQQLLLTPRGLPTGAGKRVAVLDLKATMRALGPGVGVLRHIAKAVQVWGVVTGRSVTREKMNRSRVVTTMQAIPVLEPYIQHLHRKGWSSLAQMFHPNSLEAAKKDPALRGLFGGTTAYWGNTADTLEVVQ